MNSTNVAFKSGICKPRTGWLRMTDGDGWWNGKNAYRKCEWGYVWQNLIQKINQKGFVAKLRNSLWQLIKFGSSLPFHGRKPNANGKKLHDYGRWKAWHSFSFCSCVNISFWMNECMFLMLVPCFSVVLYPSHFLFHILFVFIHMFGFT